MTDEKNPQQAKIHKGSPKRDPVSYQTTRDIVIPAGTIMRSEGDGITFSCRVGTGAPDFQADLVIEVDAGSVSCNLFKRVIAA